MSSPLPTLIRDPGTGKLLRFASRMEAAFCYDINRVTMSRLIVRHHGCPDAIGKAIGIGRGHGRGGRKKPCLGYPSTRLAAKGLGVHYTTLYRHIRAGNVEALLGYAMRAAA